MSRTLAFLEGLSRYYPDIAFPEHNDGATRFTFNIPCYS
jgi:hypothetical protein